MFEITQEIEKGFINLSATLQKCVLCICLTREDWPENTCSIATNMSLRELTVLRKNLDEVIESLQEDHETNDAD